jgi:hypothetical protein
VKFSIREVCKMLGISESTFYRKVRSGALAIEHDPTEKTRTGLPRVWVTLESLGVFLGISDDAALRVWLGLPAVKEERSPDSGEGAPAVEQVPEQSFAPRELSPFEQRQLADMKIAEDAVTDPDWRDSYGHRITGNDHHNFFETPEPSPVDSQAHMNPALLSNAPDPTGKPKLRNPLEGEGRTRSGLPLPAGMSQETYDAMMRDWNRNNRGWDRLSMSEQREAQERSRIAIHSAFPRNSERQRSVRDTVATPNGGRVSQR